MPVQRVIPTDLESGLRLLPEHPFAKLKEAFDSKYELRVETELAMAALLERLNPSDRGTRFLTGGGYEWIMAVACWASGIQVIPGGHSQNGFDLLEYMESLKGLWSIKSFTGESLSGSLRIINKMSPNDVEFQHPTVFISPGLPGLTLLDPTYAPKFAKLVTQNDEAVSISASLVRKYAEDNPDFVVPFSAPINQGNGRESPQLDIVASILTSGTYPNLGPVMNRMRQIATTVSFLRKQYESGEINEPTFKNLLSNLEKNQ